MFCEPLHICLWHEKNDSTKSWFNFPGMINRTPYSLQKVWLPINLRSLFSPSMVPLERTNEHDQGFKFTVILVTWFPWASKYSIYWCNGGCIIFFYDVWHAHTKLQHCHISHHTHSTCTLDFAELVFFQNSIIRILKNRLQFVVSFVPHHSHFTSVFI